MITKLMLMLPVLALVALPAIAADRNGDGIDDNLEFPIPVDLAKVDGAIAIVDVGTAVGDYATRIEGLGYTVSAIGAESDLETLLNYDLVILPVGHADQSNYSSFESHASHYMMYVEAGGGLWVGQPNPYDRPGGEAPITWVPYLLHLNSDYSNADCPVLVVDNTHCITAGFSDAAFSLPGDTVTEQGSEWDVLTRGAASNSPSVLFAEYGAGKILVELGHPSYGSICPYDDTAMRQYVECTMGGSPVATESISLGGVKALFK